MNATLDVMVQDHGSIVSFTPLSPAATDWINANAATESWQWMGRALNVDWRFAADLSDGLSGAGFNIGG